MENPSPRAESQLNWRFSSDLCPFARRTASSMSSARTVPWVMLWLSVSCTLLFVILSSSTAIEDMDDRRNDRE